MDLLRPWYAVLRTTRISDYDEDDGVLWFCLGRNRMHQGRVVFTLEGIQLLARLALVSVDAFDAIVNELWPNTPGATASGVEITRCVGIFLRTKDHGYDAANACFLARTGKRSPTTKYLEACHTIQRLFQDRGTSDSETLRRPDIPVHVLLGGSDSRCKRMMQRMVEFVRVQTNDNVPVATGSEEHWFNLRVTKVDFNWSEYYVVDETRMSELDELMAVGVEMTNCRQPQLCTDISASATFVWMQKLLGTQALVAGDTSDFLGLENLMLDPDQLTPEMAPYLFSAVARSRSLRKLWVGVRSRPSRKVMQWLGLAVFSSLAHHRVESVEFDVADDSVQGMADVLAAPDPLAVVFDEHTASIHANQHFRAAAKRFALVAPTEESSLDDVIAVTIEYTDLRVISHDRDWWSVLLPAWGQAWVHNDDIVLTVSPLTSGSRTRAHCIREVDFSSNVLRIDELEMIFNHVAPVVERLTVKVSRLLSPTATPHTVSRAVSLSTSLLPLRCELCVQSIPASRLDLLVDLCTMPHVARSLALVELIVDYYHPGMPTRFIQALSDPSHSISRSLDVLTVDIRSSTRFELEALSAQLVGTLRSNHHLRDLTVRGSWGFIEGFHELQAALMAHDGQSLKVPGHFPLRENLAFLSVVWGSAIATSHSTVAIHQLDSAVVSTILQFAASPRCRKISIERHALHRVR